VPNSAEHRAAHRVENAVYQAVYRTAHLDDARRVSRAYAAAHREEARMRARAWREAHLEEDRAHARAYAETHREEARQRASAWAAANPDRHRANCRNQKAKRRGAPSCEHVACLIVGPAQLAWQLNPHVCWLCGTQLWEGVNAHLDHVLPIARGGVHCVDNLRPACAPCNLSKGAKYTKVTR
jgi:5-methylcytosine-specific restriction endonuclease McrA